MKVVKVILIYGKPFTVYQNRLVRVKLSKEKRKILFSEFGSKITAVGKFKTKEIYQGVYTLVFIPKIFLNC